MRANWKFLTVLMCAIGATTIGGNGYHWSFQVAVAQPNDEQKPGSTASKRPEPTAEEKMRARFPQPVQAGRLIGLPVLDGDDSTIGYVEQIVRTPEGKIKLIVPYRKRFGWARNGGMLDWGRRPVAVPIEVVAILALQIAALDMDRDAFDKAPTWQASTSQPIPPGETIEIAIQRR